jgi:peroxiredoxin Q/BCP
MNARVVGVSPDSCNSHQKFTIKHGLGITLLSDPDRRVMQMYGAWGEKKMYGKTALGVVRSTVLIDPRGYIAHHWPKVKAKGHAAKVLETLRSLI